MKKSTCSLVVALDGPAGAGKSTTARAVAERLGYRYLDTGAMYRAVTLAALDAGASQREDDVADLVRSIRLDLDEGQAGMRVRVDGRDVTKEIRSAEVSAAVSRVSAYRAVREAMVQQQRDLAGRYLSAGRGVVVDGRDIGTVVFPDARIKVFMDAAPEVRARRRYRETEGRPGAPSYEEVLAGILRRDRLDSGRALAPLQAAADAVRLDTSGRSFEEQVDFIVAAVEARCMEAGED